MSTTFGIKIESTGEVEQIARRVGTRVFFTNSIAEQLPELTKVIAMDNSHQGIYTIKDIKQARDKHKQLNSLTKL